MTTAHSALKYWRTIKLTMNLRRKGIAKESLSCALD